jgi:hypothetical protein
LLAFARVFVSFCFFSFFVLLLESDVVAGTAGFNVLLLESFVPQQGS